jgi:hypothetical protein
MQHERRIGQLTSYLLAAAGAVFGGFAGGTALGRLTFVIAAASGALPPNRPGGGPNSSGIDLGTVLTLIAIEFAAILLGSWIGSVLGSWFVLAITRQRRSGRTAVYQAIYYPLVMALAGLVTVSTTGLGLFGFANTMATTITLANVYWPNVDAQA